MRNYSGDLTCVQLGVVVYYADAQHKPRHSDVPVKPHQTPFCGVLCKTCVLLHMAVKSALKA